MRTVANTIELEMRRIDTSFMELLVRFGFGFMSFECDSIF